MAIDLLKSIPKNQRNYKTLFGGVFATYAADKVIKNEHVDYVCRGEGEGAVVEMANALCSGGRIDQIKNFTIKGNGNIYKMVCAHQWILIRFLYLTGICLKKEVFIDLCKEKFGEQWALRPQRGCPYTCTFCNSPSNNVEYKAETGGRFHRKKSIERMRKELDFLVKKYDPNLIYFVVDTFLAMSNREFDELKELYSDYKIPFWMNTRAETITEYRAAGLEEMNMLRMNIGIEHGNYDYRRKIFKEKCKR